MAGRGGGVARALAVAALVIGAGCAHGTRSAAAREAALRRAVAALDSAGRGDVAVGYGVTRRRDVLGPVASVDLARDASRARGARLADLIEGRVPGVEVRRRADGEPLYVVDGLPMAHGATSRHLLRDVSPVDVARIDVLRGSAAAVYGARGANGVIVITLRRSYR